MKQFWMRMSEIRCINFRSPLLCQIRCINFCSPCRFVGRCAFFVEKLLKRLRLVVNGLLKVWRLGVDGLLKIWRVGVDKLMKHWRLGVDGLLKHWRLGVDKLSRRLRAVPSVCENFYYWQRSEGACSARYNPTTRLSVLSRYNSKAIRRVTKLTLLAKQREALRCPELPRKHKEVYFVTRRMLGTARRGASVLRSVSPFRSLRQHERNNNQRGTYPTQLQSVRDPYSAQ